MADLLDFHNGVKKYKEVRRVEVVLANGQSRIYVDPDEVVQYDGSTMLTLKKGANVARFNVAHVALVDQTTIKVPLREQKPQSDLPTDGTE